jgi:hypothetical protein
VYPLRAYNIDNHLIPPEEYQATLAGAHARVTFSLRQGWIIKKTNVFVVESIQVLIDPVEERSVPTKTVPKRPRRPGIEEKGESNRLLIRAWSKNAMALDTKRRKGKKIVIQIRHSCISLVLYNKMELIFTKPISIIKSTRQPPSKVEAALTRRFPLVIQVDDDILVHLMSVWQSREPGIGSTPI